MRTTFYTPELHPRERPDKLFEKLDIERKKASRSKTEITFEPNIVKKNSDFDKSQELEENNLLDIKTEYENKIVGRDLDQSLLEISNIKIISNMNSHSNCNISFNEESLNLSEKMVHSITPEIKFPKSIKRNSEETEKIFNFPLDTPKEKPQANTTNDTNKNEITTKKNLNSPNIKCLNTPQRANSKKVTQLINNHPYRSLVFSTFVSEAVFKSHLLNIYKGLIYSKKFLKTPPPEFLRDKTVNLPEIKGIFLKFHCIN